MLTSTFLWQAFVTLFVIVDPFVVVPIFIRLTRNDTKEGQERTARKACLISLTLIIVFAFIGDTLLDAMNISEPAFRIAGGFLLLMSAIEMVRNTDSRSPTDEEAKEAVRRDDISVFPLAIPLIAGPGALTSIVVLMRQAETMGWIIELSILLIAVLVVALTYLCLLSRTAIMRVFGITGTNVLTRVFGIILSALAVQNIINGVVILSAGNVGK